MNAELCNQIFEKSITDYHQYDSVEQPINNPYPADSKEHLIYLKNWIDTVQWHYEDLIRDPDIKPQDGMDLKRLIDKSNQHRTDIVEQIDDWFLAEFKSAESQPNAQLNTESPAWVVDRLSILALKIYHMQEQVDRKDVDESHKAKQQQKLDVLLEQRTDLSQSFDDLIADIKSGKRLMKVYRQMKLYNDPATNPVLYGNKKPETRNQ